MEKTLTLRIPATQDEALTRRAAATGKTKSELVRELLENALADRPLEDRVGHLKGRAELPGTTSGWRREIRERNWRR